MARPRPGAGPAGRHRRGYATVTGMASTEPDTQTISIPRVWPRRRAGPPPPRRDWRRSVRIPDVLLPRGRSRAGDPGGRRLRPIHEPAGLLVRGRGHGRRRPIDAAARAARGLSRPDRHRGPDRRDQHGDGGLHLGSGLFTTLPDTLVLVRRTTGTGTIRWGLVIALDLDHYDWSPDSRTLIRATEGTIPNASRSAPPSAAAPSRGAAHDGPPVRSWPHRDRPLAQRYAATALSMTSPSWRAAGGSPGGRSATPADHDGLADALGALRDDLDPANPVLFVMGDGNHSFASAKQRWDDVKPSVPEPERATHPARYSLVELENVHDPGLTFEADPPRALRYQPRAGRAGTAPPTQSYAAAPVPDAVVATQVLESGDAAAGPRFGVVDPGWHVGRHRLRRGRTRGRDRPGDRR